MLKEKNKPVVPARAKGRKRRPGEAEEAADPELPASTLEACKGHVRSILTHWGPAFPGPGSESEAAGPVCAVTSLVAVWLLRSAAQSPPSGAETAGLLRWLRSHVLPRPAVAGHLLGDDSVRSGLFRLYSRLGGAQGPAGPEQSVACLFNEVMLQLVAARGPAGTPLQLAVEALHRSSLHEEDEAERGNNRLRGQRLKKTWWGGGARSTAWSLEPVVKPWGGPAPPLRDRRGCPWALRARPSLPLLLAETFSVGDAYSREGCSQLAASCPPFPLPK